jgi:SlyX protein
MEQRIEELEIRIAYQEDAIATLSRELHRAFEAIAAMRAQIEQLSGSVAGLLRPASAANEKPPHY